MAEENTPESQEETNQEAILHRIFGKDYSPPPKRLAINTEQDWLAATGTNLNEIAYFLQPLVTRRKPLLLAVAGCHRIWHILNDKRLENLVDVVERFADEQATKDDVHREAAAIGEWEDGRGNPCCFTAVTGLSELDVHPMGPANGVMKYAPLALGPQDIPINTPEILAIQNAERQHFVNLIRDIFGNPFCPVAVELSWLTSDVRTLAEGIYQDRAFDRLPIVADALQDAGCDNADILCHCRGPGPHVRGCWVIDLLTGRT